MTLQPEQPRRELILVVDDDEDLRSLLTLTMRREGWEVVAAGSGREALEVVRERRPAAVLVDFQLPDMNGLELIHAARAIDEGLPCVAVTGQGSEQVAVEIMKAGAADYLVKPFEPALVAAAVRRAIEERAVRSSRLYRDLAGNLAEKNTLLENRMEQLNRLISETSTLYETARVLTSQLALADVLATVLRLAGELFQAPAASIRLLDENGARLELAAHAGLGEEYSQRGPVPLGASAAGRAALTGEPVHIPDVSRDEVYSKGELLQREGFRSLLCLPLIVRGRCIGVVTFYHREPHSYTPEELRFLTTFAGTVSIAVDNARLYGEQARLAVTDGLTGLFNHKRFHEGLAAELGRATRYRHPLSLVLIDIDHFKSFNDAHGHQAGDALLRNLAALFKAAARQYDLVARYGGDEFAFLLPQTDKHQAVLLAERLCRLVERQRWEGEELIPGGKLTLSLGVASFPEDAEQASDLVERSDQALYRAKKRGRNQVQSCQISP
jgi:diguanylate cyclase (GGDEF)-like protein